MTDGDRSTRRPYRVTGSDQFGQPVASTVVANPRVELLHVIAERRAELMDLIIFNEEDAARHEELARLYRQNVIDLKAQFAELDKADV